MLAWVTETTRTTTEACAGDRPGTLFCDDFESSSLAPWPDQFGTPMLESARVHGGAGAMLITTDATARRRACTPDLTRSALGRSTRAPGSTSRRGMRR